MTPSKKKIAMAVGVGALALVGRASAQIEEIVITAELRETNVQDTPLAVTAVSGELMEARNQTNLYQVSQQAPNVTLTKAAAGSGPSMLAFIRGVGQTDFNYAVEPGVGIYVDDVYFPTLTGTLLELLDLNRVEILRGPQGTLAGRNSIGGSVKLYSQKPGEEEGGRFSATLGSYNRTDIAGAADFEIAQDVLYARIAGLSHSEDGYVKRLDYKCAHPGSNLPTFLAGGDIDNCVLGTEGGRQVTSVRGQLRWYASDDVEVNLAYDQTNEDSEPTANVLLQVNEAVNQTNAWGEGTFITNAVGERTYYDNRFVTHGPFRGDTLNDPYINYSTYMDPNPPTPNRPFSPVAVPPVMTLDQYGVSATVDWALGDTMSLKSISAYREYQSSFAQDVDASPINSQNLLQRLEHSQWSQELRLSGIGLDGLLDYTIGGFWFEQEGTLEANVNLHYAQLNFIHGPDPTPSETRAVFANTAWHLTDLMDLTVGLRYSEDEKDYVFFRRNIDGTLPEACTVAGPPASIGNPPNCALAGLFNQTGHFEDDRVDWRVALNYDISPDFMVYGQVATGYKAGGINPRPFFIVQIESVQPEEMTTYEIGFKSSWFDRQLQLNATYFFNDYTDIQLQQIECEVPFPPFFGAPCLQPGNAGDADVNGIEIEAMLDLTGGWSVDFALSTLDFEYTRVSDDVAVTEDMISPFTPELKYAIGVQYDYQMDNGSLMARLDASYQDDIYANPTNAPTNLIEDYTLVNARLGWQSFNDDWELSFEVNNLTDEVYYHSIFDQFPSSGTVAAAIAQPRTYAVTLEHNF